MAGSPQKLQRGKPPLYTSCMLYNVESAQQKLGGLTIASCNPDKESEVSSTENIISDNIISDEITASAENLQLSVSDAMSCNFCDTTFITRHEQKEHYRSDWHRYNLKQRIKGRNCITEDQFEVLSGNISSLSGSDTDTDSDNNSGSDTTGGKERKLNLRKLAQWSPDSSSDDSDDEREGLLEVAARRLPKVYFRNSEGDLLSLYRCVIYHKKNQPSQQADFITMTTELPNQMNWAVFMAGGGHFAAAIFEREKLLVHKTFHRYVVRAKRGSAQSSRDGQGNAPKSAGASLRRYNEAALTQEIKDLITSWDEHLKKCDRIFLQAPGFNRRIFFGGKTPPFAKDNTRIRLIPFQTRRPTFNEVRRVFEMLASIECYGPEADIQDFVPISPSKVFNPETGQLTIREESQMSPRQRKFMKKQLPPSSLVSDKELKNSLQSAEVPESEDNDYNKNAKDKADGKNKISDKEQTVPGSDTSDSETEMVEMMQTINLIEHAEYQNSKKPRRKKKQKQKESAQKESEKKRDAHEEEKYKLRNALYTACKVGDTAGLKSLLTQLSCLWDNSSEQMTTRGSHDQSHDQQGIGDTGIHLEVKHLVDGVHIDDSKSVPGHETDTKIEESTISDRKSKDNLDSEIVSNQSTESQITESQSTENQSTESTTGRTSVTVSIEDVSNVHIENPESITMEDENDTTKLSEGVSLDKDSCMTSNLQEGSSDRTKASEVAQDVVSPQTGSLHAPTPGPAEKTVAMLNEKFGNNDVTLLHIASTEGHKDSITVLMQAGADPIHRDKFGTTPYLAAPDKSTRNEFRKFRGKYPDMFDYEKTNIPPPMSEEQEMEKKKKETEKRKAQKKARQERQKEKKVEEAVKQAEDVEKKRFLNLSDREKRALAADRRMLNQANDSGSSKPVLSRCYQCGGDMTAIAFFENGMIRKIREYLLNMMKMRKWLCCCCAGEKDPDDVQTTLSQLQTNNNQMVDSQASMDVDGMKYHAEKQITKTDGDAIDVMIDTCIKDAFAELNLEDAEDSKAAL